ncbi:flagellin domain-containing protein [Comamonas sp. w2-DMI]|uniref:flagellin domain-containing protein n=1 Tax=Comamonas sp. w2-DMI TaxID=3126391 RepID=UPI0032E3FA0C
MSMSINTNIISLNAQRNLSTSQSSLSTTMQRLSSGLRVNSAKDDAAGLAIAERMNAQTRGMNVAVRNANDGISMAQTAEGSLSKIGDNLQRMRELAVQAANGTNNTTDRNSMAKEFQALAAEIARVTDNTQFNSKKLLTNEASAVDFQVGAGTGTDNQITVSGGVVTDTAANWGGSGAGTIATVAVSAVFSDASAALTAMDNIDAALNAVNDMRATYGATQNRFESVVANLQVAAENSAAARSRITDADFATETANLSRSQILQQAGTAMVAQANQLPQGVLSLLR